jgi:hypothetical protein
MVKGFEGPVKGFWGKPFTSFSNDNRRSSTPVNPLKGYFVKVLHARARTRNPLATLHALHFFPSASSPSPLKRWDLVPALKRTSAPTHRISGTSHPSTRRFGLPLALGASLARDRVSGRRDGSPGARSVVYGHRRAAPAGAIFYEHATNSLAIRRGVLGDSSKVSMRRGRIKDLGDRQKSPVRTSAASSLLSSWRTVRGLTCRLECGARVRPKVSVPRRGEQCPVNVHSV